MKVECERGVTIVTHSARVTAYCFSTCGWMTHYSLACYRRSRRLSHCSCKPHRLPWSPGDCRRRATTPGCRVTAPLSPTRPSDSTWSVASGDSAVSRTVGATGDGGRGNCRRSDYPRRRHRRKGVVVMWAASVDATSAGAAAACCNPSRGDWGTCAFPRSRWI